MMLAHSTNPTEHDVAQVRQWFKQADADKDGLITLDQCQAGVISHFHRKPEPYLLNELFNSSYAKDQKVTEEQFVTWFLSWTINYPELSYMNFMLKELQDEISSALPVQEGPIRESSIKFDIRNQNSVLDKEITYTMVINKQAMANKIAFFEKLINRKPEDVFIGLTFKVQPGHAAEIAQRIKALIDHLLEFGAQLGEEFTRILELIVVTVGSHEDTVGIIV